MDLMQMLFNDPVVYYSFIGLGITAIIFTFMMFLFIRNTLNSPKNKRKDTLIE